MRTTPATIYKVATALNIAPKEYINTFYNTGYEYIENQHKNMVAHLGELDQAKSERLQKLINAFKHSPVFWFWWRAETEKTDRYFLRSKSNSKVLYNYMLSTRLIAPPDTVIDEIFNTTHQNVTA